MGRFPLTDPTVTMLPAPCLIMTGSTARQHRKTPVTLVASVSCHSSSDDSQTAEVGPAMPLLLTSVSIPPNSFRTASTIPVTAFSSLMSQTTGMTDTPEGSRDRAAVVTTSWYLLQTATRAPAV